MQLEFRAEKNYSPRKALRIMRFDLVDLYRTMYPTTAKYTFLSNLQHLQKLTRYWTMKTYLKTFYLQYVL